MSLKAIAKQLGISVTTVSRALNGYDDVSQETRARVEAEAQRRGYRPNTFARRLKMGTIDAVGLVFPVRPVPLNNNVFLEMVGEISHELARHDIDLLLIADDEQADKHGYMRMVQGRRVDALIVAIPWMTIRGWRSCRPQAFRFWRSAVAAWRSPTPGLISITMPAPAAPPAI
ncbi:ThuR [Klebsiella variicola]|nr:ThuR [Klebsiella variicola]